MNNLDEIFHIDDEYTNEEDFPKIAFWLMVFCNVIAPIPLWRWKIRNNPLAVWIIAALVNVGMWFERFNIVGSSLQHEYNPSTWGEYWPTIVEVGITVGSFGFFFTLFTPNEKPIKATKSTPSENDI